MIEVDKTDTGRVGTQVELAARLQVTTKTVSRWLKEGAPVATNGTYCVHDWETWIRRRQGRGSLTQQLLQSRLALSEAKLQLEQLKCGKAAGSLVTRSSEKAVLRLAEMFVNQLESGKVQLAQDLSKCDTLQKRAATIADWIYGIRSQLAEQARNLKKPEPGSTK